jgi:hypothetical protein
VNSHDQIGVLADVDLIFFTLFHPFVIAICGSHLLVSSIAEIFDQLPDFAAFPHWFVPILPHPPEFPLAGSLRLPAGPF